jgi:hypothetical protein
MTYSFAAKQPLEKVVEVFFGQQHAGLASPPFSQPKAAKPDSASQFIPHAALFLARPPSEKGVRSRCRTSPRIPDAKGGSHIYT